LARRRTGRRARRRLVHLPNGRIEVDGLVIRLPAIGLLGLAFLHGPERLANGGADEFGPAARPRRRDALELQRRLVVELEEDLLHEEHPMEKYSRLPPQRAAVLAALRRARQHARERVARDGLVAAVGERSIRHAVAAA